jgi:hypothetical protein
MKKQKHQIIFLAIVAIYFIFNSCASQNNIWQKQAIELQNEGYSIEAAQHIAKVENGIIPIDEFYNALIED